MEAEGTVRCSRRVAHGAILIIVFINTAPREARRIGALDSPRVKSSESVKAIHVVQVWSPAVLATG